MLALRGGGIVVLANGLIPLVELDQALPRGRVAKAPALNTMPYPLRQLTNYSSVVAPSASKVRVSVPDRVYKMPTKVAGIAVGDEPLSLLHFASLGCDFIDGLELKW